MPFFSYPNHGKTRRVKNVNIELPHSVQYDDRFGIAAAAIHFLLTPKFIKTVSRITIWPFFLYSMEIQFIH